MAEVASAYVTLMPSARGFGKQTERALAGELPQVGERQGRGLGTKISGAFGTVIKRTAVGVAAAGGAAIGTALFKGFSRLNAIDQAQAKLSGLGHSAATVNKVMDNSLAAVKGTAFGLDEAATTAAGAVAAGIKPGEQLQRTLSLVADAATIAGTDMGSMGAIFNKVAASNKVQMDVINQLHDAGVPALSLLADQMGVTAEKASEMASKGEIDFATFQAAMEKGLGGAALESGKTFSGAFKNMNAALGRLGASVLKGVFPKLQGTFTKLTDLIDKAGPGAERFGKVLGDGFSKAATFIGPVFDAIQGLFSGGSGSEQMTQFVETMRSVFESVKSIVMSAVSIIQSLWARFGGTLTTFIVTAFAGVMNVIRGAFTVIQGIFKVFASLLKGDWSGVWEGLKLVVSGFWTVIKALVSIGWALIKGVFKLAGSALKGIFVGIWNGLKSAAIIGMKAIWSAIKSAAASVGDAFKAIYTGAKNWIGKAFDYIKSIPGKIKSAFSSIWSGVANALKKAINSVLNLPLKIPKIDLGPAGSVGGQTLIPALAAGGVVTKPTLALIGEAGPEAVVPLSGAHGRRAAAAGWGGGDRPIYADGIGLIGFIRELANGEARLVFALEAAHSATMGRMG
jgi:tape measure domain-containing protein